jgi:FKBP-type peptidyl-prolyl cis-trans isomerase
MKKIITLITAAFILTVAAAQKTKPVAKPVAAFKNLNDSVSYAVGLSVANFYKQQGFANLNAGIVAKAINDGFDGKKILLNEAACNTAISVYVNRIQMQKSKGRIAEGETFLAKNKLRPAVKTTASGLQYEIITEGAGIKPTLADTVTCHYRGTFLNGNGFDNSYDRGQPYTTTLNTVIAGWTEGLQLMSVGSKYKFYVPYTLGYGPSDYNSIPGGSVLVFELELLDVKQHH